MLALDANGVEVKTHVFVSDGFTAEGGVILANAKIDGQLDCSGGRFIGNNKALALDAKGVEVKTQVFVSDGFTAVGDVSFSTSRIDGNFQLEGGHFSSALDLRRAKIDTLINSESGSMDGWPAKGSLGIDGLLYEHIADFSSPNSTFQLGWIDRGQHNRFRPQPFEQLADVFRKMGLEEDARKVMIEKNKEHANYVRGKPEWLWYGLFGKLIGYGYLPWRAFFISLGVVGVGWLIFLVGYCTRLITPTSDDAYGTVRHSTHQLLESYPKFNSFIYSLETFVPLVKLGIGDHWMPNANRGWRLGVGPVGFTTGGLLRIYYWFHITAGWVLSALWVGALTGLVKT